PLSVGTWAIGQTSIPRFACMSLLAQFKVDHNKSNLFGRGIGIWVPSVLKCSFLGRFQKTWRIIGGSLDPGSGLYHLSVPTHDYSHAHPALLVAFLLYFSLAYQRTPTEAIASGTAP